MKVWQKVLFCSACVLLLLFALASIYVLAKWSKIDRQEIKADDLIINQEVMVEKNADIDLGDGYTNVALFGVDSRDGSLGEGNRTDCIIVASLNNETKEIKMFLYTETPFWISRKVHIRSAMRHTAMADRSWRSIC